jgi:transcriptional regulator with XRE-family HTH domain
MTEDSAAGRDGSGMGLPPQRGGLKLPSLKHWRKRRGLTQKGLAHKLNLKQQYVGRVETGRLGCNPLVAQQLAEALGVDLEELQAPPPPAQEAERERTRSGRPRGANRTVHREYLKVLLGREVGSAYSLMDERELADHCEGLSWEGVLEVVSSRRREVEVLREVLTNEDLYPQVRLFLEKALGGYPDQEIRLLASARGRESSERGQEELARAIRELLS